MGSRSASGSRMHGVRASPLLLAKPWPLLRRKQEQANAVKYYSINIAILFLPKGRLPLTGRRRGGACFLSAFFQFLPLRSEA